MRNLFAIAKREIQSYLVSPIAYLVIAAFLLINGIYFVLMLKYLVESQVPPTIEYSLNFMVAVLAFVAPFLTMRLLAQELRSGTLELLLTSPVREWELVGGKFCAGLALFMLMTVPTLLYPLTLEVFGNPDWGPILSGYLGLLLFGGVLLAVGVLASSLSSNQIVAAVLGVAGNLMLWYMIGMISYFVAPETPLANALRILNLQEHLRTFMSGALDTRDIVYCLSMIVFLLFITTRVIESRRWRA